MKIKIFAFLYLLVSTNLYSQVIQWSGRYNGPFNSFDFGHSITVDQSGYVYVTGESRRSSSYYDIATIKYNQNGLAEWVQRFNGPANVDNFGSCVALDNQNNVYVTGQIDYNTSGCDIVLIKYNNLGVQQWYMRYNGNGNSYDDANKVLTDASGNIYITGVAAQSGSGGDYCTIKYNQNGVLQWVSFYNGTGNNSDVALDMTIDNSGNVYVTGFSYNGTTFNSSDIVTVKYNNAGTQQWAIRYNGTMNSYDVAGSIKLDNAGNVYISGSCNGSSPTGDYCTIKYDSNGNQIWLATYNGPANNWDLGGSLALDAQNNVYVTGRSTGIGTDSDVGTIKYNSNGVQQWVRTYNGPANDFDIGYSIACDALGNIYVAGLRTGIGVESDALVIKYNSEGTQQWMQTYNGPFNGSDRAAEIVLDASNNVYITGESVGGVNSNYDYLTVKLSQLVSVQSISSEIPDKFSLSQNYPNPFNPVTTIKFDLPQNSFVRLTVFDFLGREIEMLVNKQLNSGSYSVDWNASEYSSGVYFYKIETRDFSEVKKMMLIK